MVAISLNMISESYVSKAYLNYKKKGSISITNIVYCVRFKTCIYILMFFDIIHMHIFEKSKELKTFNYNPKEIYRQFSATMGYVNIVVLH